MTRLREDNGTGCECSAHCHCECGCSDAIWANDYIEDAAKEIERLRGELAMAQKWRNNFKLAFEKERKNTEYWYGIALSEEQKND